MAKIGVPVKGPCKPEHHRFRAHISALAIASFCRLPGGVISMKICSDGTFTNPAGREKSIRFATACREIAAVAIGFKKSAEIDEAVERINRALHEV